MSDSLPEPVFFQPDTQTPLAPPVFDADILQPIFPEIVEEADTDISPSRGRNLQTTIDFLKFTAFRQSAWIEWGGGIIGGNYLVEAQNVNRWISTGLVVGSVALLESAQITVARRNKPSEELPIEKPTVINIEEQETTYSRLRRVVEGAKAAGKLAVKEGGALWSSLWQGAAATVSHNEAVGIRNTKRRKWFQSISYGLAVGAWTTEIPPFRQGADLAIEGFEKAKENPVFTGIGSLLVSATIFSGYEYLGRRRAKKQSQVDTVETVE